MKNSKEYNLNRGRNLLWIMPVILIVILFFLTGAVDDARKKNMIGKPQTVTAPNYGKIEAVLVKPGDFVEPGKEICSYTVTDKNMETGAIKIVDEVVDVTTKIIKNEKFEDFVELPGLITAFTEINVNAQSGGKIIEFKVNEGDKVNKGDLIAKIDERDYQIALKQAQNAYDLAKIQYERVKNMTKARASSKSEKDIAENMLRSAEANLEKINLSIERCSIYSPMDGIVDKKMFEETEVIEPRTNIVKLIDISKLKIIVGIPEKDVISVKDTKFNEFVVPSLDNKKFKGEIHHLSYSFSPMAKVYPLEMRINNKERELLPGMYVKVKIIRKTYDDSIILPIFSVIPGDDEYYTYVRDGEKAEKRVLELGSFQGKTVHVKKGLKSGDEIIEKGLRMLSDGSKINVIIEQGDKR